MEALLAATTWVRGIFTRPGWLLDWPIVVPEVVILLVVPLPLIMLMRLPSE